MNRLGIENYTTDGSLEDIKEFLGNFNYPAYYMKDIVDNSISKKKGLRNILALHPNWDEEFQSIIFSCDYHKGIEDYQSRPFLNWVYSNLKRDDYGCIQSEPYMIYESLVKVVNSAEPLVTQDMVEELGEELARKAKINHGLKTTKAIQRICKLLEVTEIKDYQPVTHNGVTQDKDYGWNHQYAVLCDALTPQDITRWTVISLHPFAYLTMSFGWKWGSCQTLDKEGLRGYDMNGSHTYNGCYMSGTFSYMGDRSTAIFYTIDPKFSREELLLAPKLQRCNFHISETGEILVQGRVYPDGRDGGDNSLAAQYRQTMQKVLSDCCNFNNLWSLKKGTDACYSHTETAYGATHYRDYTCYDDCSVSILKGIPENMPKIVYIGSRPVCPCCGEEHGREDNIICERCDEEGEYIEYCHCCGERINTEYESYYYDDWGSYWCCLSCAENDDYHVAEDDNEYLVYHESDLNYEDSTGTYWRDRYDRGVNTPDGSWYHSESAANDDGWQYWDEDGEYHREDDFVEDAFTGKMFPYYEDPSNFYEHDDNFFVSEENMKQWIEENEPESTEDSEKEVA